MAVNAAQSCDQDLQQGQRSACYMACAHGPPDELHMPRLLLSSCSAVLES